MSLWAPLRLVSFRALWAAQMASNIAIWVHTVSAQWVLTAGGSPTTVVAAVQAAITLPFFLLALPAGVLVDAADRRRVLVPMQVAIAVGSLALAAVVATDLLGTAGLLVGTLVIGSASAIGVVAWQSLIPDLVDHRLVPAAATLDGMSFNAGRIAGPALGGLLLTVMAPQWIFALNAGLSVVAALAFWTWTPRRVVLPPREPWRSALRAGVQYMRHSPPMRRLLVRLFLWTLPASLIWALLPLVAHDRLGLQASGFGLLFSSLGIGAVIGGVSLQPLRARLSSDTVLAGASIAYGVACMVIAAVTSVPVVAAALAFAGAAWIAVLSMVMAIAQVALPPWVRARGLAVVLLVHQGCQAGGSLLWGGVGDLAGVPWALVCAGVMLVLGGVTVTWFGLRPVDGHDAQPVSMWNEPVPNADAAGDGPLLVLVEYDVPPHARERFLTAIVRLGRSRRRIGARRWQIYRHSTIADRYVEAFTVPSLADHVQQESLRWTRADKRARDEVETLAVAAPTVHRLVVATPIDDTNGTEVNESLDPAGPRGR